MRVRLLAFASAGDAIGSPDGRFELADGATVGELRCELALRHPRIGPLLPRIAIAVDGEIVPENAVLADGVEVALLPPVSGG